MTARQIQQLIDTEDIIKAARLNKFGRMGGAKLLMLIMKLNKINELYEKIYHKDDQTFLSSFFEVLDIKFDLPASELDRIPKEEPFITISNHPYGGLDGLILLKMLGDRRPDYKLLVNFLLERIEPLNSRFLPVNPFEDRKDAASRYEGIRRTLEHLKQVGSIGFFPLARCRRDIICPMKLRTGHGKNRS